MKGTIAIYKKELLTLLVNPTNYVIAAAFFLVNAYLFFADLGRFNFILNQYQTLPVGMPDVLPNLNEEVIGKYLSSLVLILVFAIPVLSMSAMTEESAQRTFDLLLVSPVKITAIVLGKYLALLTFVLFLTSSALCLPALLLFFGNPEHGPVFSGFVSLILCACAFTSLCLGISAFTKSSMVAAFSSMMILFVLFLAYLPAQSFDGAFGQTLSYLSPAIHSSEMIRGTIQLKHIVYFGSLTVIGWFLSNWTLERLRWR